MWTIAAANKKFEGPLGSYNGLTDVHLSHYFSTPSRQSHLKAAKLIKSDGSIIPGEKVKMASLQHEKKKKIYDILANTIIQNASHKGSSWNKKLCSYLEDILKMENVETLKGGSRKNLRIRSNNRTVKEFPTISTLQSCNVLHCNKNKHCEDGISTLPRLAHSACKCCFNQSSSLRFNIAKLKRSFSSMETSPYASLCGSHACKFNNGLQQIIHLRKKKKKHKKKNPLHEQLKTSTTNMTAISKVNKLSIPDPNFILDQCKISLYYHGHTPLTKSSMHITEEVLIRQQHCGGTSVVVYKGKVRPKEILSFTSLTHDGYSFSITLFLDGIRYLKLSSCCVFRYSPGKRLGGASGNFSIRNIQGGKPCEKCQYHQFELSNKDIKTKVICSENTVLQQEKEDLTTTNHHEVNETASPVSDFPIFDAANHQANDIETEDSDSSVVSEIINSQGEELENNLKTVFSNDEVENEVIESEEVIEDSNVSSINEDINDPTETNSDTENTSSMAESVKKLPKPEVKPYTSESSDDEDGGKQHVVLVSVHGTPSRST